MSRPDDVPVDGAGDLHDPRREVDRMDNVVLAALGEPMDPEFSAHLAACPQCRAELDALAQTAGLAREGHDPDSGDLAPSSAVWDSIAAELGLEGSLAAHRTVAARRPGRADSLPLPRSVSDRPRDSWSRRARTWSLAAAAAVLAVITGGLGYALGQSADSGSGQTTVAATARLLSMPGGPAGAEGTAKLLNSAQGKKLSVSAVGLPPRSGYYEVWLFNPDLNQMVAVGTLATNDSGTFPVPAGLDPAGYSVVDVSAQNFDGNPVHQQSVLRGRLSL